MILVGKSMITTYKSHMLYNLSNFSRTLSDNLDFIDKVGVYNCTNSFN